MIEEAGEPDTKAVGITDHEISIAERGWLSEEQPVFAPT